MNKVIGKEDYIFGNRILDTKNKEIIKSFINPSEFNDLSIKEVIENDNIIALECLFELFSKEKIQEEIAKWCIHYCVCYRSIKCLKFLIKEGFDVNLIHACRFNEKETPLLAATDIKQNDEFIELLLDAGATISTVKQNYGYANPLKKALCNCSPKLIKIIIEKYNGKINTNHLNALLSNPKCTVELIQILIDRGVKINRKLNNNEKDYLTQIIKSFSRNDIPLKVALNEGNKEIIQFLIEKGAVL